MTAQREYQLVSGFHKLHYVTLARAEDGLSIVTNSGRVVDLDADNTKGYSFVGDGTYRTTDVTRSPLGAITRVRVTSVDATTGKTLKTLMSRRG